MPRCFGVVCRGHSGGCATRRGLGGNAATGRRGGFAVKVDARLFHDVELRNWPHDGGYLSSVTN